MKNHLILNIEKPKDQLGGILSLSYFWYPLTFPETASTSTNKIAKKAGISIGSLYQYFPNKDAIFASLRESQLAEMKEFFQTIFDQIMDCDVLDKTIIALVIKLSIELDIETNARYGILSRRKFISKNIAAQQKEFERFMMLNIEKILRKNTNLLVNNNITVSAHIIFKAVQQLIRDYNLYRVEEIDQDVFIDELAVMLYRCIN